MPTYRGPISLNVRLLPGSNVTLTGGTSDGSGGVYLTSDVTIASSGGGGGSAPSGTGVVEVVSGAFTSPARTAAVVVVAGLTADPTGARSALSLGGAALLNVGTSAGTVAAGDDSRITGAVQASTLTTRGDLLVRDATSPARLAVGATNTVLMSNGTDPGWYTVSGLLSVLGSTRGMTLRYGASSAWEAVSVGTSGQVWRSNGTDPSWYTLTASDVGAVPTSRTINGYALSSNVTLTYTDVGADASGAAASALSSAQSYADALVNGIDPKPSVYSAEVTSNITLSGTQTVGGVSCAPGKRVLLTTQSTGSENGIWLVASGAWTRPPDSVTGELTTGAHLFVEAGSQAGGEWLLTTADPITVGSTAQTWVAYRKMQLSTATPQPLGVATAGLTGQASDAGHVHAMPSAADVGAVPTTRTLTTTAPLRIGGGASADLSADRTLSVNTASTSAVGVVQLESANPQPLGSAAPGSTGKASDSGHVHALPSLATLGAGIQRAVLPVSGIVSSPTNAATVCGWVYLDPSAWAITGKTLVATLEVMGNTSAAACTATAALYTSSTGVITDATTTISAQTPTRYTHTLTVPGGATLYELRVTPSGGTGGTDYAVCNAVLTLTWS